MKAQTITIDSSQFSTVVICEQCGWREQKGTRPAALTAAALHLKHWHGDLLAARRVRYLVERSRRRGI